MRPAEPQRLLRRLTGEEAVEEARGEAVAAADAVEDVELGRRGRDRRPVHPGHGAPAVPVRREDLAQRRRDDLHARVPRDDGVDHPEERGRVELRGRGDLGSRDSEPLLQVLLVPDEDVDVLDDPPDHVDGAPLAPGDLPELGPVVEVERGDGARGAGLPHPLDDQLGRRLGERREDAAAVEPPNAAGEESVPVDVARAPAARRLRSPGCRRRPAASRRSPGRCRRPPCSGR